MVTFLDELGLYLQHRAKLVSAKGPTEVEGRRGLEVSTHLSLNPLESRHFLTPVGSAAKKSEYYGSPRDQTCQEPNELPLGEGA